MVMARVQPGRRAELARALDGLFAEIGGACVVRIRCPTT